MDTIDTHLNVDTLLEKVRQIEVLFKEHGAITLQNGDLSQELKEIQDNPIGYTFERNSQLLLQSGTDYNETGQNRKNLIALTKSAQFQKLLQNDINKI